MFTGIIEEIGTVKSLRRGTRSVALTIQCEKVLSDTKLGDSISVNGVCLTVTDLSADSFQADVMAETLDRSSLSELRPGSALNLERAMPLDGRFGGHIVSGHIDGVGHIRSIRTEDIATVFTVQVEPALSRYMVDKGSVTIDGISLTVIRPTDNSFQVSIIPHTSHQTTLLQKKLGDRVNIEVDILAKYVEKLMGTKTSHISYDFLAKHGF